MFGRGTPATENCIAMGRASFRAYRGINGSTLSESNDTGLVDLAYLASRHVSLIQLATASIPSAAGSIAILGTIPSSPLFDLQFIYGTGRPFAEVAMVRGLLGLLFLSATQRVVLS